MYDLDSCIRHPNQRYEDMALYVSDIVGLQTDYWMFYHCNNMHWEANQGEWIWLEFQDWFLLYGD